MYSVRNKQALEIRTVLMTVAVICDFLLLVP